MSYCIGLINPPWLRDIIDFSVPINLATLSATVKEAGFDARILDLNLEAAQQGPSFFYNIEEKALNAIDRIADDCNVFGFTTSCYPYPLTLILADRVKNRYNKPVILGGPQATFTANHTLSLIHAIDAIVLHEGEHTLVELMSALKNNGRFEDICGLAYRGRDGIVQTPLRPFIEDLDTLPIPDFSALDIHAYLKILPDVQIPIDNGRGCPFSCSFCSTSLMWKRRFRMKSPERVIEEMNKLHELFGVDFFFLTHDQFTSNRKYVMEFCNAIYDEGYVWHCYSRCDTLDDELVRTMHDAGCVYITFGVETGSERMQRIINKNLKMSHVDNAIKLCNKHHVSFKTAYIIGFPEETIEDLEDTLIRCFKDKAENAKLQFIGVLSPMPGTAITSKYFDHLEKPVIMMPDTRPFWPSLNDASAVLLHGDTARKAKALMKKDLEVFSASYFIEPENFTIREIFEIQFFYMLLLIHFPLTTHLIFKHFPSRPLHLLEQYRRLSLPYEEAKLTADDLELFFKSFIKSSRNIAVEVRQLINEMFSHELALYRLSLEPQPRNLPSLQLTSVDLDTNEELAQTIKIRLPSIVLKNSFTYDILGVIDALSRRAKSYPLLESKVEIIYFINWDQQQIVIIECNKLVKDVIRIATAEPTLAALRKKLKAKYNHRCDDSQAMEALVDLIEKGFIIVFPS